MGSADRELSRRCPGWDKAPISYTAVSFLELMKILIKYSIPDGSDKKEIALRLIRFYLPLYTLTVPACMFTHKKEYGIF